MTIDVKKVAKLANLPLTPEEEETYSKQLEEILRYIDQLNSVDTENIPPTYNVSGLSNVMAADEVSESLSQDMATRNGPQVRDGYFVTRGVFEE